jgi:hypothetical protein
LDQASHTKTGRSRYDLIITSKETIKIQGNKHQSLASKSHTLKDVLEARCGGGVEKGPTMDGEWRNKHGEDQQNCKTKKHTKKRRREKQYREILKQLQENPTKTKFKGKSKQNKTKETKYSETKENKKQNDQPEKVQAQFGRNTAKEGGDERMVRWGRV